MAWLLLIWSLVSMPAFAEDFIEVGSYSACALDALGVECWNIRSGEKYSVPRLSNPRSLSVNEPYVCAIDDEGVKCWGFIGTVVAHLSGYANPRQLSLGSFLCVLDDAGVQCRQNPIRGRPMNYAVPPLKNPSKVVVGYERACAIEENLVSCWGNRGGSYSVQNPRDIKLSNASFSNDLCVLGRYGDDYVDCETDKGLERRFGVGGDGNKIQTFAVGSVWAQSLFCALVSPSGKVTCNMGHHADRDAYYSMTALDRPFALGVSQNFGCVLEGKGTVGCWEYRPIYGKRGEEIFRQDLGVFSQAELDLTYYQPYMTAARAQYLKPLIELQKEAFQIGRSLSRQLLLQQLAAPSIRSIISDFFSRTAIPRLDSRLKKMETRRDGVEYIGPAPKGEGDRSFGQKAALTALSSALSTSLNFLPSQDQGAWQSALRACAQALQNPSHEPGIEALLAQIDSLDKKKLMASEKSAFLVDAIAFATNWLKGKL